MSTVTLFNLSVTAHIKRQNLDTRQGFKAYAFAVSETVVVDISGDATGGVATHASLRSIIVKHSHFEIRDFRRTYQNYAVASYTEMAVAHFDGQLRQPVRSRFHTIYIYVIIADAVHFGEPNHLGGFFCQMRS